MTIRDRVVEQGKKIASSGAVLRLISNDRVMRVATSIMDAKARIGAVRAPLAEAVSILVNGHALPNLDPALDGEPDATGAPRTNGAAVADHAPPLNGAAIAKAAPRAGAAEANGAGTQGVPLTVAEEKLADQMRSRTSLSRIGGRDVFEKCFKFMTADNARSMGVYPFFRPLDFNNGPEAQLEGRKVIMLGSNNYLGLTTHPRVREAAKAAIDKYGTSMTGSRLVNGTMKLHKELEDKLAAYHGKEAGLVFTTGYQVNIATISALCANKRSVAVIDKDDHASIYDGVRLAQAAGRAHGALQAQRPPPRSTRRSRSSRTRRARSSSPTASSAPRARSRTLVPLVEVVKKHKARILVDDAHALGVIGPGGRGTAAHFGVADQVDLIGGTFSKSLASIGGWLVGDRKVLDYVQHFAYSFLFAASAAPPCVPRRWPRSRSWRRSPGGRRSCGRTSPTCARSSSGSASSSARPRRPSSPSTSATI